MSSDLEKDITKVINKLAGNDTTSTHTIFEELEDYKLRNTKLAIKNQKYRTFLTWMLKQQYYILPSNIKKKIKQLIGEKE